MGNVANMSLEEQLAYWNSLKLEWDDYSIRKTAEQMGWEKGREEGREEGRGQGIDERNKEFARAMLQDGKPIEEIVRYTGLSPAAIEQLK